MFQMSKRAVLRSVLFIVLFSSVLRAAANVSAPDSADILRRIAFQDSIFNQSKSLQNAQLSPKKNKHSSLEKHPSSNIKPKADTLITLNEDNRSDSIQLQKEKSSLTEQDIPAVNKKQKKTDTTHYSAKKAAIWAAACPGLGQIYNKKYWKLPIVYGAIGAATYFVAANAKKLRTFNGYIRNIYDSVPNPSPYNQLDLSEIETFRNNYRRNVQIAAFGTIFAWGLSIVDAVVDAHLKGFDISDKLTLKVKPELNYSNLTYYTGIGVNLRFK